jgi:hypothetical protein
VFTDLIGGRNPLDELIEIEEETEDYETHQKVTVVTTFIRKYPCENF